MHIELKKIDKDTLKVGDVVGVARKVSCGWGSSFRHQLITPAQITRITPKRTKFFTDKFGEHDKREVFYECDVNAGKECYLAKSFQCLSDGIPHFQEHRTAVQSGSERDGNRHAVRVQRLQLFHRNIPQSNRLYTV